MRRLALLLITSSALAACSDADNKFRGPPTGRDGRAVRTPCDAGLLILLFEAKLTCALGFPKSPDDERFFDESYRPCRKETQYARGGAGETVTYDDANEQDETPGATYNADGNLATWDVTAIFGGEERIVFEYLYEDGLLV